MKIYFLSSCPCALKIDGELVGQTDGFERYLDLYLKDEHFVEFLPVNDLAPVRFYLRQNILFTPPKGVKLGHAPDVLIVYACNFPVMGNSYQLLARKNNAVLFSDGAGCQLFVNGKLFPLPGWEIAEGAECEITEHSTFFQVKGGTHVCVIARDEVIFCGRTRACEYAESEGTLRILRDAEDFLGGKEWLTLDCKIYPRIVNKEYIAPERSLPKGMLTAQFLQSGDRGLLCEELQKVDFSNFFGRYERVIPTGSERVALCYRTPHENVFTLRFFHGETDSDKITNITRVR